MRRSWSRFSLGVLLGSVAITLVLVAVAGLGLQRGLPDDLSALQRWQSPDSLLRDRTGAPIATFALVEAVEAGPPPPTLLAEAFLAAAPPSFYEPRVDAATSLPFAVLRIARGEPASASPLSLALARALLRDEPPGVRRSGREELLSTRIEVATTVTARVEAWLDQVPLCRGRRGLLRARRDCLGTAEAGWTDAEMATLAAAAAWNLDLAGDRHLLAARRDAVLESLVRRGLVDAAGARTGGLPNLAPTPPSPDCIDQLVAAPRRGAPFGGPTIVNIEAGIDSEVRELLQRVGVDGALLLDVDTGVVRACRQGRDDLTDAALGVLAVAGGGEAPGMRWLPEATPVDDGGSVPELVAWQTQLAMKERGGLRWSEASGLLLLVHPTLAGAVSLRDPDDAEQIVGGLARLLPRKRTLLPDGLEVVDGPRGPQVRRRRDPR